MSKDMLGSLLRALVGVPKHTLGLILDIANRLSSKDGESFYVELAKFVRSWRKTTELAKPQILHLLSAGVDLEIGPTTGNLTLEEARKTFSAHCGQDFKNWGICGSGSRRATSERKTEVHEMRQDANFSGMFNSLNRPLKELVFTFDEFEDFCRKHSEWLRRDGYATFFLIEENNELFVAYVYVSPGGLGASVRRFGFSYVWSGDDRHRVVVPQQELGV